MLQATSFTDEVTEAQKGQITSLRWLRSLDKQGDTCTSPIRFLSSHMWLALDPSCPTGSRPYVPLLCFSALASHITGSEMLPGIRAQAYLEHVKHLTLKLGFPISGLPNLANAPGGKVVLFSNCFHLLDALPPIPSNGPENPYVVQCLCPANHSCCYRMRLLLSKMHRLLPTCKFRVWAIWARST